METVNAEQQRADHPDAGGLEEERPDEPANTASTGWRRIIGGSILRDS